MRRLFEGGDYSRAAFIRGNTVAYLGPGLQSYPEFYLLVKKKTNHKDDNK